MKNWSWVILVVLILSGGLWLWRNSSPAKICLYDDTEIGQEWVCVYQLKENSVIESPLALTGVARGYWYFEASFPVELQDANNNLIAQGIAQAHGDWMTEELVPFTMGELKFAMPTTDNGKLVLKKDNPSGLPENDASLEIPVRFK